MISRTYSIVSIALFLSSTLSLTTAMAATIPEAIYQPTIQTQDILYPKISPYKEGNLQVSKTHKIWYGLYGNPNGVPVVFIHGGPGAGCEEWGMRYFDPKHYNIILFDQRGAKRSAPVGELRENTTQNLINDIHQLRQHLDIPKWLVYGYSWGSALALLYGEQHPENCSGFVVGGIFLGKKSEYTHGWYGTPAFPAEWKNLVEFLPPKERKQVILNYYRRVMNPDPKVHLPAAAAFMKYFATCSKFQHSAEEIAMLNNKFSDQTMDNSSVARARIFTHYYLQHFFMQDNQVLKQLKNIKHLPAIIVHGRYDAICMPGSAYELHEQWPGSKLVVVPDAGHASLEPSMAKALVEAAKEARDF